MSLVFLKSRQFGSHICSLKNYKESCFWPGRTAQNHLKISAYRFLGMAIAVAVVRSLTKSLWDKVCILLNNGNFAKITISEGFSPIPPLTPSFWPPQMKFDSLLKKHPYPWPSHKKKVQLSLVFKSMSSVFNRPSLVFSRPSLVFKSTSFRFMR